MRFTCSQCNQEPTLSMVSKKSTGICLLNHSRENEAEAVDETLSFISQNTGKGSSVIFDYTYQDVVLGSHERHEAKEWLKLTIKDCHRMKMDTHLTHQSKKNKIRLFGWIFWIGKERYGMPGQNNAKNRKSCWIRRSSLWWLSIHRRCGASVWQCQGVFSVYSHLAKSRFHFWTSGRNGRVKDRRHGPGR